MSNSRRYSLRRAYPVEQHLGEAKFGFLEKSTDQFFDSDREVEIYQIVIKGTTYNAISVPNTNRADKCLFEFVLLSITYNVYNLAFNKVNPEMTERFIRLYDSMGSHYSVCKKS